MSNGMIIFLAFLSFIVLNGFIDAIRDRGRPSKRDLQSAAETQAKLESVDKSLQDISDRLTAIEGILQTVE